jgi:hypothetical protein
MPSSSAPVSAGVRAPRAEPLVVRSETSLAATEALAKMYLPSNNPNPPPILRRRLKESRQAKLKEIETKVVAALKEYDRIMPQMPGKDRKALEDTLKT